MEVKTSYKQTEVGVIPEDWVIKPFGSVVKQYIDYRGRTPKKLGMHWGGGDILALSANNVQMGHINPDKEAYYGSTELYRKWMVTGECEKGDVILTMEAPLGNVAQIPDDRKYILSQRVILIKTKSDITKEYLYHLISGQYFQKELLTYSTGSTATGIQRQKLDKLPIYFPESVGEQTGITTVLSDADALVTSLEKLISKKRNIKQGAMQQLLTGKERLPGFSGEWLRKDLSQLCVSITDGTHRTPKYVEEGIPFYSVENVIANNFSETKYITLEEHTELIRRCKPEKDDILLTRIGAIGATKLVDWDVKASIYVSLALLKINDQIDKRFLYWYTKTSEFLRSLERDSLVNAIPPKINMGNIGKVAIRFPPSKEEQTTIAQVLSDMDAEIEELELKLAKYKMIKQGMMQELLTGKRRLT